MAISSKFITESTGEKNVKIGQYLAKIWIKYDSLVFWATLYLNSPTLIEKPRFGRKNFNFVHSQTYTSHTSGVTQPCSLCSYAQSIVIITA